jgi:hypothetical protein
MFNYVSNNNVLFIHGVSNMRVKITLEYIVEGNNHVDAFGKISRGQALSTKHISTEVIDVQHKDSKED